MNLRLSRQTFELVFSSLVLAFVLLSFSSFLQFIESRPGVTFVDPLLETFLPMNLTWITFGLVYGAILLAVYERVRDIRALILTLQCYALLTIFRALLMWSLPLEPPTSMIVLLDPFVEIFGGGSPLTKDLFFSGHTSITFLLFLTSPSRLRWVFLVASAGVAFCVLAQHVHYTVDVLVAPFVSFASFQLIRLSRGLFDQYFQSRSPANPPPR